MDHPFRRVAFHAEHLRAIHRRIRRSHTHFYQHIKHWSLHAKTPSAVLSWARERRVLAGCVSLLALLVVIGVPLWASSFGHGASNDVARVTVALALPPAPVETAAPVVPTWKTVEVQPGETLSEIFQTQGLGAAGLASVMALGKDSGALTTLHPGDELGFQIDAKGQLAGFRYQPDSATLVTLTATNAGLQSTVTTLPVERRLHFAHGEVHGSLFAAGEKAGLSEVMVLKLADVFKYDIDFVKDLKKGDQFTVVYDDIYRNGSYTHAGDVIAAEFVNNGHRYTAYRFKQADGSVSYYSQDGRPLRKALLRTPVAFTRISSRFGMRKHPILGYTRMHKGVDYAAPTGTPIHAAGNGVIVRRGWVHGYGNFIEIKDTPKYSTAYGHMSRFAKGLHVGSHVHQGEVIGYVGQTGMATGPHLHYEVRVNGHPENPLTVTMPKPEPLSPKLMVAFKMQIAPMVARIQMIDHATQRIARVDTSGSRAASTN